MWWVGADLPCGPVIGACHTCRPIFGTPCRVWRAPSQLDSSWPAAPRGTGTSAPPMLPRWRHRWDYSPAEQIEAETPWAWALTASTVQRQSKQPLLALWFCISVTGCAPEGNSNLTQYFPQVLQLFGTEGSWERDTAPEQEKHSGSSANTLNMLFYVF